MFRCLCLSFLFIFSFVFSPRDVRATEAELLSKLRGIPGITSIRQDAATLWIGVTLDSLGSPPTVRAQEIADHLAQTYKGHVGKGVCVRVYYGNENQLAKSCTY